MKRGLDRALRLFGDVRAGEGATVLLMCLNVFLLLMAYYILKTVREPLILLAGGAELKSYAAAAQALTLVGYVPLYGWVAQKLPRQQFLAAVILFFVGCIQLFFLGSRPGRAAPRVRLLRLGRDLQPDHDRPVLVVRERALHAAGGRPALPADRDRLDGRRARSVPRLAGWLFGQGLQPVPDDGDRRRRPAPAPRALPGGRRAHGGEGPAGPAAEPIKAGNGFALVLKSPYLRLVALLLVLLNIVNTVGEYILGQAVVAHADAAAGR